MVHLQGSINMKNNLPQLGASTWQTVLRVSQVLIHQSLLKLEEKHFQIGPSRLSAGDPAWWESPRPALGQFTTYPLPSTCAAVSLPAGVPLRRGKGTTPPVGRASDPFLGPNPVWLPGMDDT